MRRRLCPAWLALLALVSCLAGVGRAGEQLRLGLRPWPVRPRTSAPFLVDAEFDWQGAGLLEGAFELGAVQGVQTLWRCRVEPLVLTGGQQRFRFMLPAALPADNTLGLEANARFVTKDGEIPLGTHTLRLGRSMERCFVIAVCAAAEDQGTAAMSVPAALSLESFDPRAVAPAERGYCTTLAALAPAEMPTAPLSLYAYDLVVVVGQGLSGLAERQLDALRRWVEAGGSACVAVEGQLDERQARAVGVLAGRPAPAAAGPGEAPGDGSLRLRRLGLGRLALMTGPPSDFGRATLRAAAFLWRFREPHARHVATAGTWSPTAAWLDAVKSGLSGGRGTSGSPPPYSMPGAYAPHGSLIEVLLEGISFRLLPVGMVLLLLLLLIVAVGPGDYFVLGLLKARRLTWVVFPGLCVGFAVLMVLLAEGYLGRADQRRGLVFVDVGEGGRVLRWTRYEVLVAGREKPLSTERASCLFVHMVEQDYDYSAVRRRGGGAWAEALPAGYAGRFPAAYRTEEALRQWTPVLSRVSSLEPFDAPLELDWDAVTASDLDSDAGRRGLLAQLTGDAAFDGSLLVCHGNDAWERVGPASAWRRAVRERDLSTWPALAHSASVPRPDGFLGLVSQISPNGADDLDDLALLDPEDSRQWLLAVIVEQGDDVVVYRRLYREGR
jgi:hypothetical protein